MSICLPFLLYVCIFLSKMCGYTSIEDSMAIGDPRVVCFFKFPTWENDLPQDSHELSECVSSSVLLRKMIYHKNHICNLCCLHKLYECVHLIVLFDKMIFYISNIDDFLLLMYSKQTNFPQVFKSKLELVLHVPAKNSKKLLRQTWISIKFWITFV